MVDRADHDHGQGRVLVLIDDRSVVGGELRVVVVDVDEVDDQGPGARLRGLAWKLHNDIEEHDNNEHDIEDVAFYKFILETTK